MNTRPLILVVAIALLGGGLVMTVAELLKPAPVVARVAVAVAATQIEPYTIITQDMVRTGDRLATDAAFERGAYALEHVVGLMSTARIGPGSMIVGTNAKPVEDVRFVQDFNLEIVSFAAGVDRTVGGRLRPGHMINLYGYGRDAVSNVDYTTLIEPRLWVVGVSAGGQPVSEGVPQPDLATGAYREVGDTRERPTTLITVAVTPEQAFHIIDALGAQGLNAWATLSANRTPSSAIASPVPATPAGAAQPVPTFEFPVNLLPTAPPLVPTTGSGGAADSR